jgi:hypothetical protein
MKTERESAFQSNGSCTKPEELESPPPVTGLPLMLSMDFEKVYVERARQPAPAPIEPVERRGEDCPH